MQVKDIFEQLAYGELSSMAMGGADDSGIQAKDYPRILTLTNLALAELHKRFALRTKTLTIQQYDHISEYVLHPKYAETNTESEEPVKYIKDSRFDPFEDGSMVLKIEAVFDENGEKYFLNDSSKIHSLFTPSYNSVQVPFAVAANAMEVQYRCGHDKLAWEGLSTEEVLSQEVSISSTHLNSLLLSISSRFLATRGNQKDSIAGSNQAVRFEQSVNTVKNENLDVEVNDENTNFDRNGWV